MAAAAWPDLSIIRSRVRSLVNEESTSIFLPDTILNRFINEAERDIATKTGCLESVDSGTTSSGSRTVAFSGYKVKYVEYVGANGPIGLQRITLKHLGHAQVTDTTPQYWAQWGTNLIIEPLPPATPYTLTLYVSDFPAGDMAADTDEPSIPSEYHEDIIQFALFRTLLRDRKWQLASYVYNKYIESIMAKKSMLTEQKADRLMAIKIPDYIQVPQPPKGGN